MSKSASDFVDFAEQHCGTIYRKEDGQKYGRKISPGDRTDYLLALILVKLEEIEAVLRNSA